MSSWKEICKQKTVKDIVRSKHKNLIFFKTGTKLSEVLKVLEENNILGAPVIDVNTNSAVGFVDVLDITGFVIDTWGRLYGSTERDYAKHEFFDVRVEQVLDYSKVDYSTFIFDNQSVADLIAMFNDKKVHQRLHRVAVSSPDGRLYNVVSQSDIIAFANAHKSFYPNIDKTIYEMGIIKSTVISRIDAPFYEALEVLYNNRMSGIALVDNNGHIDANLSASDLRGLTQKSFSYFTGSTLQFLSKGLKQNLTGAPITCTNAVTISEVLEKLTSEKIHRVYVTGMNDYPYGVVTMGDIISILGAN